MMAREHGVWPGPWMDGTWGVERMKVNFIWIVSGALVVLWLLLMGTTGAGAYWVHIVLIAAIVLIIGYTLNRPTP